jgi:prepilin-type N-terminal cleavage/methylation domain-containing protein
MLRKKGFTLVEMLVVIALMAVISMAAFLSLYSARSHADLSGAAQQVTALLRQAQSRSASQVSNVSWGVHFDNTNPDDPFIALFTATSTASGYSTSTAAGTFRLPVGVCYENIVAGSAIDIVFSQITGETGVPENTAITLMKCVKEGGVASWTTTTHLPKAIYSQSAVSYNGYVYSLGGSDGSANPVTSTVVYAKANPDGTLGDWNATTPLPGGGRYGQANVVTYDGYLYLIGGYTHAYAPSIQVTSTVIYAKINLDGTLGNWSPTNSLSAGEAYQPAVTYRSYVYLLGGYDDWTSKTTPTVTHAMINPDGTLGAWSSTTPLPSPVLGQSAAADNGYLYSIGGMRDGVPTATVIYAKANPDGTLGDWNATTPLPNPYYGGPATIYNGYLYMIGGNYGVERIATVIYAKINPDGTLGVWSSTTPLPSPISGEPAAVAYNGYVYTLGGNASSSLLSTVFSGAFLGGANLTITISPRGLISF